MGSWRYLAVLSCALGCSPAATQDTGPSGSSSDASASTSIASATMTGAETSGSTCAAGDCATTTEPTGGGSTAELDCLDGLDDDANGRIDCFDAACWSDPNCTERRLRLATFNIREVGTIGSEQYEALVAVLRRIDADIACLQEVGDEETPALEQVAMDVELPFGAVAFADRPGAGMIRAACLSRIEIADIDVVDEEALSEDPVASDLTRALLRIRLAIPRLSADVTVLTGHLKAGTEDVDRFRRMVEFIRLRQAIELERAEVPDNVLFVVGDLNEVPGTVTGQTWSELPPALPFAYQLGSDIALPLTFDPFAELAAVGLRPVVARVEDGPYTDTYLPGLIQLDYVHYDPDGRAQPVVAEAYEACQDDGVDDGPLGDRLPKAGDPLPCGTGAAASDHRPVVVDFHFE